MTFLRHNAIALLALFVALSGTAVASSVITSKQIKDGTIQSADLSTKLKRSLIPLHTGTGSDLSQAPNGPSGPSGATGALGAKGDKGDTGAPGTDGQNATSRFVIQHDSFTPDGPGIDIHHVVTCPEGMAAVGGGYDHSDAFHQAYTVTSMVPQNGSGPGTVAFTFILLDPHTVDLYATCAG